MSFDHEILQILLSVIAGAIIGIEREFQLKSAGLRTMILVTLGSCMFTMLSTSIGADGSRDRIAANIITGIGFVGAGVIFKEENRVSGLATAVTIWICAALGMAIGSGYYVEASIGMIVVVLLLIFLKYTQASIDKISTLHIYKITILYDDEVVTKYETLFKKYRLKPMRGKQIKQGDLFTVTWRVQGGSKNHDHCSKVLLNDKAIIELSF